MPSLRGLRRRSLRKTPTSRRRLAKTQSSQFCNCVAKTQSQSSCEGRVIARRRRSDSQSSQDGVLKTPPPWSLRRKTQLQSSCEGRRSDSALQPNQTLWRREARGWIRQPCGDEAPAGAPFAAGEGGVEGAASRAGPASGVGP